MTDRHLHGWPDATWIRMWWPYLALTIGVLAVALGGVLFSHVTA